jgi:hypothetical protein
MKSLVANGLFAILVAAFWMGSMCAGPRDACAVDWLTLPSNFTHSPQTGERVHQFAQVEAPPLVDQTTRVSSGYTHYRSTIQYGQSADNYHRVDQWGPPVRPYGEWQFPYRPYSAPYQEWGAPFAGLNLGFGFPGQAFPPSGVPYGTGFNGNGVPGAGLPGAGLPGAGLPGNGFPGNQYPYVPPFGSGGIPGQPYNPYPTDPNGAYPVPPWYDGFHPDLPTRPRLNDREFFRAPSTIGPTQN